MDVRFLTAGERCVTVSFGNEISIKLNTRVRMLCEELKVNQIGGVMETVPTYCALSVHYDPSVIRRKELEKELMKRIISMRPVRDSEGSVKEVPVYYGGETGPDLEHCAELEGISTQELIRRHCTHSYYVFQLGFSPGHPYMARSEEPFSFKRRETPRVDIPAHSVVVQQNLTNITPFHQPSGWNIIGSTPVNITDYNGTEPFFFKAGDRVRFIPIDKAGYDRLLEDNKPAAPIETVGEVKGFVVESPGALTTIQDEGRFGYQASGVSPAGPMDHHSFHLANILVGNSKGAAALEVTVIGPCIRFTKNTLIAITGADLSPMLNGVPVQMYRSIPADTGDVLSFGMRKSGCRAYVAFGGGIMEHRIMGSCATDIKNGLGGHKGRALMAGDEISLGYAGLCDHALPQEIIRDDEITVRVVTGPQDDRFTREAIRCFFNHSAAVTDRADRQGIRLECAPLEFVTDCNIISDGISLGAIQVAGDGKPIILMSDRQSVGGYAKLGNVIYADLPKLAQAMPGCRVRFVEVSLELAEELYIREMEMLNKLEDEYSGY